MAGRGAQTFHKRQKEQQRKEKQQEKFAKRIERKRQLLAGETPQEDSSDEDTMEYLSPEAIAALGNAAAGIVPESIPIEKRPEPPRQQSER